MCCDCGGAVRVSCACVCVVNDGLVFVCVCMHVTACVCVVNDGLVHVCVL